MSTVSDAITSTTTGSMFANVGSTVSSIASATVSTVSSSFTAFINTISNAFNTAGSALKKGWNASVSSCKEYPKITGVALLAITAGAAYAGRAQIGAIPAAVSTLIGKK